MAFNLPTIVGLLDGWAGTYVPIGTFATGGTLTEFQASVSEADPSVAVSVEITTAPSAGNVLTTLTIPAATLAAQLSGLSLAVSSGTTLYLHIASAGPATLTLNGWVGLVVASPGVAGALTTLAIVKEELGEPSSVNDALLQRHIDGVSSSFRQAVGRPIVLESVTEWLDGPDDSLLILSHFPVANVSIEEDGVAVAGGDLLIRADRGHVVRFPSNEPTDWSVGELNVKAVYNAGYSSTPADIVEAVTKQVIFDARKTSPYGLRVGDRSSIIGGNQAIFMVDAWLPGVVDTIRRWRQPGGF